MLFGSNGSNYSMQMSLGPMAGSSTANFYTLGGFFAAANVTNYGSTSTTTPELVDGELIAYQPGTSSSPQIWIARFKASPTNTSFELFFAANEPNIQGATSGTYNGLGDGFRMISDGTHIYADGILFDPNTSDPNGTYYNFNACLNASTMAVDSTESDCQTLANSFTIASTPSLNFAEVTGYNLAVVSGSSCAAVNQSSFTSSSTCPATYGPPAPVAQSSVFTNLNTYFPIANANITSLGN